ncbi:MAG: hypothetical protein DWQ02_21740 [Bacteroidetes bacterium]|nr:MAG: hypothetical protein DWQ02_21740 [Bacteroidota bacterium]
MGNKFAIKKSILNKKINPMISLKVIIQILKKKLLFGKESKVSISQTDEFEILDFDHRPFLSLMENNKE